MHITIGWRQSALGPLQGVPHPRGCALQEPGQRDGPRPRPQQPRHLMDGESSSDILVFCVEGVVSNISS